MLKYAKKLFAKDDTSIFANKNILKNEKAIKLLCFGCDFGNEIFIQTLRDLEKAIGSSGSGASSNTVEDLEHALIDSVSEALQEYNLSRVRVGISGGLDSRLLYGAIKRLFPEESIYTFTSGQPGHYDYEFINKYKIGGKNHKFVDLRDIVWDIGNEVAAIKEYGYAETYRPDAAYRKALDNDMSTYFVHGFPGEFLTGYFDPFYSEGKVCESWELAVDTFVKKNNFYTLQEIFDGIDLTKFVPDDPKITIPGLNMYNQLDFGLRICQRHFTLKMLKKEKCITPYTNPKWYKALLSVQDISKRNELFFRLIGDKFSDVFPEVVEEKITNRIEHNDFRKRLTQEASEALVSASCKNKDGSEFKLQVKTKKGTFLPGRQFCEYAQYYNNKSFKDFVDELFSGLRKRKIFSKGFLLQVFSDFLSGEYDAARKIKGLLHLELNLRAGTIVIPYKKYFWGS